MEQLAIRLTHQKTMGKPLVIPQAGEEANELLREIHINEYATQLLKGEDYTLLNPVIALTFTDFAMFEGSDDCISRFRLIERDRFIEYSDDVELIFVELPKFVVELNELKRIQDKWIYFVKNAGSLEYVPDALASDPGINQAFSLANEAAMSREELEIQFRRRDFIILQRGSLQLAESRGREEGIEIGREAGIEIGREEGRGIGRQEGEQIKAQAIARNMLNMLDDAAISAMTDLSIEQIRQLRREETQP